MKFFTSPDQSRDAAETFTFNYPNMIETYPSKSVKLALTVGGIQDKYRVLQYEQGDILCNSDTTKSVTNCEKFVSLITSGKIPRSLGYSDILDAWISNFDINGINPGVPLVVLQAIISELCRDGQNYSTPFRQLVGTSATVSDYGYKAVNLNEVSAASSVMAGLSFERLTDKFTSAFNMSNLNLPQKKSPIEQVLTM